MTKYTVDDIVILLFVACTILMFFFVFLIVAKWLPLAAVISMYVIWVIIENRNRVIIDTGHKTGDLR